jgi:hypothetical protein
MPKIIKNGLTQTRLAAIKTWKITKIVGDFIKKYSDICVVLPIAMLLFTNCYWLLRLVDPTAMVLDFGNLSILVFNFLTTIVTFVTASFIYTTYFHDGFTKGWEKQIGNPVIAKLISGGLWLSTLVVCYFILTRNL